MASLAEIQRAVHQAVVSGDVRRVAPLVVGGGDVTARLSIHHRHYQTSLVTALVGKFPATAWLVGTAFLEDAAEAYVREHPPRALCIAEYGEAYPRFLGERPAASHLPYLRWFGELEWHLGQVSLAVDRPPLDPDVLSGLEASRLADAVVELQTGVRYLHAPWPVDDVMRLFLTDTAPDRLALAAEEVWIEIRGARGQFAMRRLDSAAAVFRQALGEGRSLGEAADIAIDLGVPFDPGASLAALIGEGLLTAVTPRVQEDI